MVENDSKRIVIMKSKEETYSLTLTGFKTKAQVEAFISWYCGQGEQDAAIWFEELKHVGKLDIDFMGVDSKFKKTWNGNNLTAKLKI